MRKSAAIAERSGMPRLAFASFLGLLVAACLAVAVTAPAQPPAEPAEPPPQQGAHSLTLESVAEPGTFIVVQPDLNRPGADIRNLAADDVPACEAACRKEPGCVAFTWVKPEVQASAGVCWLKSRITLPVAATDCVSGAVQKLLVALPPEYSYPAPLHTGMQVVPLPPQPVPTPKPPVWRMNVPNISGTWYSNVGIVYTIKQNGPDFTWTAAGQTQTAVGKFTPMGVVATWTDPKGDLSATGEVAVDTNNYATGIRWSNGVVFVRK